MSIQDPASSCTTGGLSGTATEGLPIVDEYVGAGVPYRSCESISDGA